MATILMSPAKAKADIGIHLESLAQRLIFWPELSLHETDDYSALDEAIENLFGYDWLILKNEHATDFFLRRLQALGHQPYELDGLKLLALGEVTEQRLISASVHIDIALGRFSFAKIVQSIQSYVCGEDSLAGLNFLVPSANVTREPFQIALEDAGARVDSVAAYATTDDARKLSSLTALLLGGAIDFVVFTKPPDLHDFAAVIDSKDLFRLIQGVRIICGDQETRAVAAEFGLTEAITTNQSTPAAIADLVNASRIV